MLVITLGTPASGSTWLFNVVKRIFAAAETSAVSVSAGDGLAFIDHLPAASSNVILKAHAMDPRLMRIAEVANARIIVTMRDPLDSAVSQIDRFNQPLRLVLVDLTRSFSTIAMISPALLRLTYVYENRFTENPDTISEIATFLGMPISTDVACQIFQDHRADVVKQRIEARLAGLSDGDPRTIDLETQWHPGHISDGRIGKGQDRLHPHTQEVVAGCLRPLSSDKCWKRERIRWSSDIFSYADGRGAHGSESLQCSGSDDSLIYGPYLFLPAGRWRAMPRADVSSRWDKVELRADVYLPDSGREALAERTGAVSQWGSEPLAMEFDHEDHFQPVEVRLRSCFGQPGKFRFHGVDLEWLGPPTIC